MRLTLRASPVARRLHGPRAEFVRRLTAEADWIGTGLVERLAGPAAAERAVSRYRSLLYRGRRVECPVCGGRFRHFKPAWNRPGAICPGCQSQERHRALWLFLSTHPERLAGVRSLLHLAPEPLLEERLRGHPGLLRYVSADLHSPRAMDRVDVMALPYPQASFDAVLCSHVLEHVEDDRRAMRELHRVLRPGGWVLVMVPIDPTSPATLEDPSISTLAERRAAYRQEDHVRLYGTDLPARLDAEGFATEVVAYPRALDPAQRRRYGLNEEDELYFAYRPKASG